MKSRIIASVILALFAQVAYSATPVPQSENLLYCAGESWYPIKGNEPHAWSTDALVIITKKETYIDINSIGAGISQGMPQIVSSIQSAGRIILTPEPPSQQSQVNTEYSINRFSGKLIVAASRNAKRLVIFDGTCKKAEPLF